MSHSTKESNYCGVKVVPYPGKAWV